MIIKNAKVFTDGCRFVEKDLVIRDGRIAVSYTHLTLPTKQVCRPLPISRPAKVYWPSAPPR